MIKISIIIATWNADKTLQKCLDSIIPQLTKTTELIIIDGESTDNTNAIIQRYANLISYSISEKDSGIYDAWNKGVKAAKGEWVMFVGADDILLPNAMSAYLFFLEKTKKQEDYDYICALNEHVDKNGKLLKILGGEPVWSVYRKNMNAAHVASLHSKKNLFESIGYYDINLKICSDYDLLLRKRNKLKWLFLPVHIARMQVGGMSFSIKAIKETYKIRRINNSVSHLENVFLFFKNIIFYYLFIVKNRFRGGEI